MGKPVKLSQYQISILATWKATKKRLVYLQVIDNTYIYVDHSSQLDGICLYEQFITGLPFRFTLSEKEVEMQHRWWHCTTYLHFPLKSIKIYNHLVFNNYNKGRTTRTIMQISPTLSITSQFTMKNDPYKLTQKVHL
jgi:hypothetical protein